MARRLRAHYGREEKKLRSDRSSPAGRWGLFQPREVEKKEPVIPQLEMRATLARRRTLPAPATLYARRREGRQAQQERKALASCRNKPGFGNSWNYNLCDSHNSLISRHPHQCPVRRLSSRHPVRPGQVPAGTQSQCARVAMSWL
jgi:hypothetical protein